MNYHYEIIPKGKKSCLYRLEEGGPTVKLAFADDKASMFRLVRMKNLFEETPLLLAELHEAEAYSFTARKTNKPSWGPVGLTGGVMEVWEISEAQTTGLKKVRERAKDGLHKSVLNCRTVAALLRHNLVKERKSCKAYLVLTEVGQTLLGRLER